MPAGTYQPSPGRPDCLDAKAGPFVQSEGPPGTSRASRGPTSPRRGRPPASMRPGPSSSPRGPQGQPCQPGTYRPLRAVRSMRAGPFRPVRGATGDDRASRGPTLQGGPCPKRILPRAPAVRLTPDGICRPAGDLPALAGAVRLPDARAGHFVQSEGATGDEPCQPGTYATGSGSLSQADCITSASGYVMTPDGTPCQPGTYQPRGAARLPDAGPATVQSEGPPGTSRASRGPTSPLRGSPTARTRGRATSSSPRGPPGTSRQPGTYQPSPGQAACLDARPGHCVQWGGHRDEPCQPGTYQPSPGRAACLDAGPGPSSSPRGPPRRAVPAGDLPPELSITTALALLPAITHLDLVPSIRQGVYEWISKFPSHRCIQADPGHYVDLRDPTSQIPCEAGGFRAPWHSNITGCISPGPDTIPHLKFVADSCPPEPFNQIMVRVSVMKQRRFLHKPIRKFPPLPPDAVSSHEGMDSCFDSPNGTYSDYGSVAPFLAQGSTT